MSRNRDIAILEILGIIVFLIMGSICVIEIRSVMFKSIFIGLYLISIIICIIVFKKISLENSKKNQWYSNILDSISFPISVTDKNMIWTFVNKAVTDMLKKSKDELVGKHCSNWGAKICNSENCGVAN